jgi:hypothetical protein
MLERSKQILDEGHGFSRAVKNRMDEGFSPWGTLFCHSSRAQSLGNGSKKPYLSGLKPRIAEKFTARLKPCPSYSDFSAAALLKYGLWPLRERFFVGLT